MPARLPLNDSASCSNLLELEVETVYGQLLCFLFYWRILTELHGRTDLSQHQGRMYNSLGLILDLGSLFKHYGEDIFNI